MTETLKENVEDLIGSLDSARSAASGLAGAILSRCEETLAESIKYLKMFIEQREEIIAAHPDYDSKKLYDFTALTYVEERIESWQKLKTDYEKLVISYGGMVDR